MTSLIFSFFAKNLWGVCGHVYFQMFTNNECENLACIVSLIYIPFTSDLHILSKKLTFFDKICKFLSYLA